MILYAGLEEENRRSWRKSVCRVSQTKGKEAAVQRPNGSSKVKTGAGSSNAGVVSAVNSRII